MFDLRFYKATGKYEDYANTAEFMLNVEADAPRANGLEVIAGKVIKFLLTYRGTDAFNEQYGGIALHYPQISEAFIPQLTMQLYDDVERCEQFIKTSEENLYGGDQSVEKLYSLTVKDLKYNPSVQDRIDIFLEIITTKDKRAVVAVTNRTDH